MMQTCDFEKEVDNLIGKLSEKLSTNNNIEFKEFDESNYTSLLIQGLGAGTAGLVTGMITRFLPIPPAIAAIAAGFLIKRFVKNNIARQYAHGLMIAGIGNLVAGFTAGMTGGNGGSGYPYPVR